MISQVIWSSLYFIKIFYKVYITYFKHTLLQIFFCYYLLFRCCFSRCYIRSDFSKNCSNYPVAIYPFKVNHKECVCDNWKPSFLHRALFNWRTFLRGVTTCWWRQWAKNPVSTNQNSRKRWCQIVRETICIDTLEPGVKSV